MYSCMCSDDVALLLKKQVFLNRMVREFMILRYGVGPLGPGSPSNFFGKFNFFVKLYNSSTTIQPLQLSLA